MTIITVGRLFRSVTKSIRGECMLKATIVGGPRPIKLRHCLERIQNIHDTRLKVFSTIVHQTSAFHVSSYNAAIVPFNLSDIGEGITEVAVKEWFVKVGDKVSEFDSICEVQSDKASVTITSRYNGIIKKLHYEVDDTAFVGKPLVSIEVEDRGDTATSSVESSVPARKEAEIQKDGTSHVEVGGIVASAGKPLATPAVRRLAMQYNVQLKDVRGTGKDGRILKEDILQHISSSKSGVVETLGLPAKSTAITQESVPKATVQVPSSTSDVISLKNGEERVVPISTFMKGMVKSMTHSKTIPHFGVFDDVNMSQMRELRTRLNQNTDEKLTYLPFVIKAVSLVMNDYPIINASIDEELQNIIYKGSHNIGIAMDTPFGLVVPVIKDVQQCNVLEINSELKRLQALAMKGSLSLKELSGCTFTISNIGPIGCTYAFPLIIPPQVAIVALGKIQVLPKYDSSGALRPEHIMGASWTADHRIVAGAELARFSNCVKEYLENPGRMLLSLK